MCLSPQQFSTISVTQILHCFIDLHLLLESVLECFFMKLVNKEFFRIFCVG